MSYYLSLFLLKLLQHQNLLVRPLLPLFQIHVKAFLVKKMELVIERMHMLTHVGVYQAFLMELTAKIVIIIKLLFIHLLIRIIYTFLIRFSKSLFDTAMSTWRLMRTKKI